MVRPKKHLGQHFLTDPGIARRIAEAIPESSVNILEIGPGKGALTIPLLALPNKNLRLAEIDSESVEFLVNEGIIDRARIKEADFLKMPLDGLFDGEYWVVGNFPYNISSQILFRMYENASQIPGLVGMFQKEVAQRIAAGPGSKTYGILSVLIQSRYSVEYLFTVNEGSFFPPPKVKSAVIRVIRDDRLVQAQNPILFTRIVKTAFNQRRKTLRNALKQILPPEYSLPEELAGQRAEQLSVAEFIGIADAVDLLQG